MYSFVGFIIIMRYKLYELTFAKLRSTEGNQGQKMTVEVLYTEKAAEYL